MKLNCFMVWIQGQQSVPSAKGLSALNKHTAGTMRNGAYEHIQNAVGTGNF